MVAQIKKFKKLSPFIFEFCFWEDPPHPVNWSPNTLFYRYLSNGRSNPETLSNDRIVTWVTQPERPKGAKDEVKEA